MDSSGRITRDEAARILGVSPSKVLWLAAQGHLADSRREVTRKSVQAEQKWRATASCPISNNLSQSQLVHLK